MFFDQVYSEACREELIDFAAKTVIESRTGQNLPDRYIAMSQLQKAVRRGELKYAWAAAGYLLVERPETLWKRLAVVALEDVGVANIPGAMQVLQVCKDAKLRNLMGGSEAAAYIATKLLCQSAKDRSSDDLFDVITRDPAVLDMRAAFAEGVTCCPDAVPQTSVIQSALDILRDADALDLDDAYVRRTSNWINAVSRLPDDTVSPLVKEVAVLGLRKTRLVLGPLLAALAPYQHGNQSNFDDPFLPERIISGVPSWALGAHTRVGLDGFRRYLGRSEQMHRLLAETATGETSRPRTVGGLVFRLECGMMRNRINWFVGHDLQNCATHLGWGLESEAVPVALDLICEEWELVNDCRRDALTDYSR